MSRDLILKRIADERRRHANLPGSENDLLNSPNDFLAIVGSYLFECSRKLNNKPKRDDYEDSLIKAAAIILAALEACSTMQDRGMFVEESENTQPSIADILAALTYFDNSNETPTREAQPRSPTPEEISQYEKENGVSWYEAKERLSIQFNGKPPGGYSWGTYWKSF